jgi:hypothetical protein
MVYLFESFRNALLFLGFGTGFLGFEDVFMAYERTISLPGMPPLAFDSSQPLAKSVEKQAPHRGVFGSIFQETPSAIARW